MGCCRSGRRQSRSLRQQSHPTRFVAGVGNLRHTSAHKGSPVFRRRAPAPNTVDPEESPGGSREKGARRLFVINGRTADQWNRVGRHSWSNRLLALRPHKPGRTRTPSQKESRAGEAPHRAGRMPRCRGTAGAAGIFAGVRTPWVTRAACAQLSVCLSMIRRAACPCSPGSDCTTRRRRSCLCVGASGRYTTGRPAQSAA